MKTSFLKPLTGLLWAGLSVFVWAGEATDAKPFRLGIIGCDTSHATAFARIVNRQEDPRLADFRVTAAYQWGSRDIHSSTNRYPKYLAELKGYGVEMKEDLAALLASVDGVLLETNDGRPRYAQALEVFRSGKPCFIDKPVTADLADAIRLVRAGERLGAKWFSTSSMRFLENAQRARQGELGAVRGATCWSPSLFEPTQSRYYWYAVHAAEPLFTIMGTGCETVNCVGTGTEDVAVGTWRDGRIGVMRTLHYDRPGAAHGGTIHLYDDRQASVPAGSDPGYGPLLASVANFFRTGETPVSSAETLEIYAFLAAAERSHQQGGAPVKLKDVLAEAAREAERRGSALGVGRVERLVRFRLEPRSVR